MKQLEKKLLLWQEKQFISEEQRGKILAFENSNRKPYFFFLLACLFSFIIALGVISLVAANWKNLHDAIKIGMDFVILALLSYGLLYADKRNIVWASESALLGLFFAIGASLGLMGQVFQISDSAANSLLGWALLSAPLLLMSPRKTLPLFWTPVFAMGIFGQECFTELLARISAWLNHNEFAIAFVTFAALGGIVALLARLNRYFRGKYPILAVLRGYGETVFYFSPLIVLEAFTLDIPNLLLIIATYAIAAFFYFRANAVKMVKLNIVLLGVVFFLVYLQVIDSLLATGIGMLSIGVIGLLILYLAHLVLKNLAKEKI